MREHSFYNVGHGDTITIEDDHSLVVRDCGRYHKNYQFYEDSLNLALSDIKHTDKKKYAILSHAHNDHFSGFQELYNQNKYQLFEETFIPPLVLPNGNLYSGVSRKSLSPAAISSLKTKINLYLKAYASLKRRSSTKQLVSNWFFLLPIMNFLSKKVVMVSCGDQILNQSATVLWPPLPNSANDEKEISNDSDIYIERAKVINDIEVELNLHDMDISPEERLFFDERANSIVSIYSKIIEGDSENDQPTEEQKRTFVEKIEKILEDIDRVGIKNLPYRIKQLLCSAIRNDDDNMSLVFQYNDASAIYLSDIDEKHIPLLISIMQLNGFILPEYVLLKSSHHGTRYESSLKSIKYNLVVHTCGIGISRGRRAHKGPNRDYCVGKQNTFCLDWDYTAMQLNSTKWDPVVLGNSTVCSSQKKIFFNI